MRFLFSILLLANLGFLAWQAWVHEPPRGQAPLPAGLPRLEVVAPMAEGPPAGAGARDRAVPAEPARVADEPTETAASMAGTAEPPPVPRVCVSLGPFGEPAALAAAAARLRDVALSPPRQRPAEGQVWAGHWVYLEYETRAEARQALDGLEAGGFDDGYLIPGEENQTVSLGLFSELARAARLSDRIRALGFEPIITDRTTPGTVYWLDLEVPTTDVVDPDAVEGEGARNLRLEARGCPE
jgi:hypothetical protein